MRRIFKARVRTMTVALALLSYFAASHPSYGQKILQPDSRNGVEARQSNLTTTSEISRDYTVGIGDTLRISIWKQPQMSETVVVRPDGKITVPFVNDVEINGLTTDQIHELLETKLKPFVNSPQVTVSVETIESKMVYVTGKIVRPGAYPIILRTNVLELIAKAGGLAPFEKGKHITIFRNAELRTAYELNYQDLVRRRNPEKDLVLQPDDIVVVK